MTPSPITLKAMRAYQDTWAQSHLNNGAPSAVAAMEAAVGAVVMACVQTIKVRAEGYRDLAADGGCQNETRTMLGWKAGAVALAADDLLELLVPEQGDEA